MTDTTARSVRSELSVWLFAGVTIGAGALAGAAAQTLRDRGSDALSTLGGATAIWVAIGFVLVQQIARSWPERDRIGWISILAAAYLFAWLIAYHALFAHNDHLAFSQVWGEERYWIAAVAPACLIVGFVAVSSLEQGWLGDACLVLPLGWSLPEVYLDARDGGRYLLAVSIPTLLVALLPLARARGRRWNFLIAGAALVVSFVIVYFLHSHLTLDDPSQSRL